MLRTRAGGAMPCALMDQAPDAVIVSDRAGRVTRWNGHAEGLFGWRADEAIGRTIAGLIVPPEYREAHRRGIEEAARAGLGCDAAQALEVEGVHRDGRRIPIELRFACVRDGADVSFTAFVRDVSRRRTAERRAEMARAALADSERRLAEALRLANLGSFEWDLDTDEVRVSEQLRVMLGLARTEALTDGGGLLALVHPEDRPAVSLGLARAQREGASESVHRIVRGDGAVRWVHGHSRLLPGRRVTGTVKDITERRASDEAARKAEEGFRQSFDLAPIGLGLVAPDGHWQKVSPSLCRLIGHTPQQLIGRHVGELIDTDDQDSGLDELRHLLAGRRQSVQADRRLRHASGHLIWVQVSCSLVRDDSGRPLHFIAQLLDIGARKAQEDHLREIARRDELTELLNRRGFEEELERQIAHIERHGRTAAVLMIDLDGFKAVNDAYGHEVGDGVLQAVAAAVRERLRKTDVAARLGGDEFAILLPEASVVQARRVASQLAGLISERGREALPQSTRLAASIGVASLEGSADVAEVLRVADSDMYAIKRREVGFN